jgi:hypothetical protein
MHRKINSYFVWIFVILHQLGKKEYGPGSWRLFIDSSIRSLKAVLLYNSNVLASIPLAHSTTLSESLYDIKVGA